MLQTTKYLLVFPELNLFNCLQQDVYIYILANLLIEFIN